MQQPIFLSRSADARGIRPDLIVAIILAIVALATRAQTFGNPVIGFDEQFYLVVGDRMLQGAVPFVDIFDRKPIGLFLIFAFTRLLGGEGTLQYQLVATLFVWATAFAVWRFALRVTAPAGALCAAVAYLIWLCFMEGQGGQAPVFFNLPVLLAAMLVERAVSRGQVTAAAGLWPMLLVGVAIQIKYTALFEGIFFGCVLVYVVFKTTPSLLRLAACALAWIAAALLPTEAAYLAYVAIGQGPAFLFANFQSMFGKLPDPLLTDLLGLLEIVGILAPIFLCAFLPQPVADDDKRRARRFVWQWLAAAIIGMLAMRSFGSPQYAMPLLAPLVIAIAPRFGALRRPPVALVSLLVGFIISQVVLLTLQERYGRASDAALMTRAAQPRKGCLFVYDGYPAMYRLTHSCLLSRFVFPGHLNMANEADIRALGVDPQAETRRIMAARPETVMIEDTLWERGNHATFDIVRAAVKRDYVLVLALRTGSRQRLVYRRK